MILTQKKHKKKMLGSLCLHFLRSVFFLLVSVNFLWFAPCSMGHQNPKEENSVQLTDHEREWLSEHKVILIAPDPDFPPIDWIDDKGNYRGISADFMQVVQQKIGINFKVIKCQDWNEVLEKAKLKEVDAIPAAAQTPGRSRYLTFSEPHIILPGVIITRTRVTRDITLHDLSTMRVSVVKAYVWQEFLETDFPQMKLDLVKDLQEGLKKVALGISDALVATLPVALYYIEKEGITNLRVAGETGYYTRLSFASRKDWPELNAIVRKALAKIPNSKKEKILGKWIYLKEKSLYKQKKFWITIVAVFGGCGLIILSIALWNRSLRRMVDQRTEELKNELVQHKRAQEVLKRSEEKFAKAFNHGPTLMTISTLRDGKYMEVNGNFVNVTGYSKEEAIGTSPIDLGLMLEEELAKIEQKLIKDGHVDGLELVLNKKNKDRLYCQYFGEIITIDGEKRLLSIANDITDRKKAEMALRESERKHRVLVETISDIVFILDANGRFIFLNPESERVTGYRTQDFIGCSFTEILVPEYIESTLERFRQGLSGKTIPIYEVELKHKNGKTIPVELKVTSMLDADGNSVGRIGVARDIRDRKQAEGALRESELKFRSLFDFSPQPIALSDIETGRIFDVNHMFCELTQYSKKEILGLPATEIGLYSKEERNSVIEELKTSGEVNGLEMNFKRKDGKILNAIMFARIVQIAGESFIMSIFINITEQKRLEAQLQQAQRMEALGTLGGGVAHDFNNLLMGIQGRTSLMMMDKNSSHPDFEHLQGIKEYVKSAADLTKQLLGFSRGGKYEAKPTDINELIKKTSRMFGRTKKEIKIHEKYQQDVWTTEVDRGQINQVLMNLYVNAWQAMPDGGELYLQTENITLDENHVKPFEIEPGGYVKISVTDTGVGMDEDTQKRIFDPFFTTKEMGRGTGLGLASAYGIIKNHGGFINVYSEKGEGSTFNIYLSASEKEVVEEKEPSKDVVKGSGTVLLVDDEEMIIDIGEQLLKKMGYAVLIAKGGKEAIKIYKKKKDKIDIVILDMIMPEVSGGDTFDRIKEIKPTVKVLLSTGYSINGKAAEILKRGCDGFIQKPFDLKQLSKKLREIFDKD